MDSSERVNRAELLTIRSWTDGEADRSFVSHVFQAESFLDLHIEIMFNLS